MKPSKKSKKCGAKGSVAILKASIQLVCVSQDSYPRKYILRGSGKLGSKHTVKLSKGTWHKKNRERKGPSRRVIQWRKAYKLKRSDEQATGRLQPKFQKHPKPKTQRGMTRRMRTIRWQTFLTGQRISKIICWTQNCLHR